MCVHLFIKKNHIKASLVKLLSSVHCWSLTTVQLSGHLPAASPASYQCWHQPSAASRRSSFPLHIHRSVSLPNCCVCVSQAVSPASLMFPGVFTFKYLGSCLSLIFPVWLHLFICQLYDLTITHLISIYWHGLK